MTFNHSYEREALETVFFLTNIHQFYYGSIIVLQASNSFC